jgi:hypothetical protein
MEVLFSASQATSGDAVPWGSGEPLGTELGAASTNVKWPTGRWSRVRATPSAQSLPAPWPCGRLSQQGHS